MSIQSAEATPRLPSELVALIHHVELSKAGWRDNLLDHLVLSSLYLHDAPLSLNDIKSGLESDFGLVTDDSTCHQTVQRLLSSDHLVEVADSQLTLSHQASVRATKAINRNQALEARVAERFKEIVRQESIDLDSEDAWSRFRDECLDPLVKALGARTYELISNPEGNESAVQTVTAYTGSYSLKAQEAIKRSMDRFLDPTDIDVRSFVLSRLHSHFLTLAASLSEQSLQNLSNKRRSNVQLKLLLDTNFLFSALDLHDNPANQVAQDLIQVLEQVKNHVRSKLYVFPLTVDEVVKTLSAFSKTLSKTTINSRLGRIARDTSVGRGNGIGSRFLRAVANSSHRLTVDDYFGPYIRNLVAVLRGKGLEFYNENVDGLTTSQDVIDDILAEQEFQSQRSTDRQKSYTALRHDVSLWHFAAKKRSTRVDSPLDAVYWVVTVDHRFLRFDRFRSRKSDSSSVPVCIHPGVLIQMLQLWIPRTARLDETMLRCVRAFLPQPHKSDIEGVTLKILRALSRFEDVNDLPEETVSTVLLDSAIRERMGEISETEEQDDLIRDAVSRQFTTTQEQMIAEAEERVRAKYDTKLHQEKEDRRVVQGELQKSRERIRMVEEASQAWHNSAVRLEQELECERTSRRDLEERIALISDESQAQSLKLHEHEKYRNQFRRAGFIVISAVLVFVAIVGPSLYSTQVSGTDQEWSTTFLSGVLGLSLVLSLLIIDFIGQRMEAVNSWRLFVYIGKFKKWIGGIIATIIGRSLTRWMWDR